MSVNRFSAGFITPTPAAGAALVTLKGAGASGLSLSAVVREIGIFNTSTTAFNLALARPANNASIAETSPVTGFELDDEGANASVPSKSTLAVAWGTAPTLGDVLRRGVVPAAAGGGLIWTWPDGAGPTIGQLRFLMLWSISVGTVCHGYIEWTE